MNKRKRTMSPVEPMLLTIEDTYELPDQFPVLWAYAAGQVEDGPDGLPDGWLRCVVPSDDTNRARWPTHPTWQLVQAAFLDPMEVPPQFGKIVRKRWEEHTIEKGIEALNVWVASDGLFVIIGR